MNSLLLGLAISLCAPALKDSPKDIVGIWTIESLQTAGKPHRPMGSQRYEFTADGKWRQFCADCRHGNDHQYTIDSTKNPIAIDLILIDADMEKAVQPGIVHVEGDTMTICVDRSSEHRPTEFKAGPSSKNAILVLKRQKPKE